MDDEGELICPTCNIMLWERVEEAKCTRVVSVYARNEIKVEVDPWREDDDWHGFGWYCVNSHPAPSDLEEALNDQVEGY